MTYSLKLIGRLIYPLDNLLLILKLLALTNSLLFAITRILKARWMPIKSQWLVLQRARFTRYVLTLGWLALFLSTLEPILEPICTIRSYNGAAFVTDRVWKAGSKKTLGANLELDGSHIQRNWPCPRHDSA